MKIRQSGHENDAELPTEFVGHEVVDTAGDHLGVVSDVLADPATLEPRWLVVDSGLLKSSHFVPVEGSSRGEDGHIVVPYDKDTIQSAVKATRDHVLSPEEERELADHYGLE